MNEAIDDNDYIELPQEFASELNLLVNHSQDSQYLTEIPQAFTDKSQYLAEGLYSPPPRMGVRVRMYSKERELPHFRLDYKGKNCRYYLENCEPMDMIPRELAFLKDIKKWHDINKEKLKDFYKSIRPSDAPPQTRI